MFATHFGWAQFDSATVLGTVQDSTGAILPGSSILLTSVATGTTQQGKTNKDGRFEFPTVRIGDYYLAAEMPGFSTTKTDPFRVQVGARQEVNIVLRSGSASETVNVRADTNLLETENSSRGQVIESREITNLPLNGRAYADLALLVPGVNKSAMATQGLPPREASFNVNGQRGELNNFILDGLDNNSFGTANQNFSNQAIQITPDALAEFKVSTDSYSAEFGHSTGAVINATSRGGTNQFHGRLWEYLRNTSLNAIGPFQPAGGQKPVLIQNQFGAALGGPILHDKLFFFGDYEGLRTISRQFASASIPTAAMRSGNLGTPIRNPYTGVVYSDGVIPASQINKLAVLVNAALPQPNGTGISSNYTSLPRGTIADNKGDFRADAYINQHLNTFARYSERHFTQYMPAAIPGPAGGYHNGNIIVMNRQVASGLTYVLSPQSVLDARMGFTWIEGSKQAINTGEPSLLIAAGLANVPTDASFAGSLNTQAISGYTNLGRLPTSPQLQNPFSINPKVNYTRLQGAHSIKIGYEYLRLSTVIEDFHPKYGADTYAGNFSKPAGGTGASAVYNYADFLFGARSHYELNNYVVVNVNQSMHFLYFQDDWKVSSKLTANLGLRYELATPQWESNNKLANFDPSTAKLIQASSGSVYNRALVNLRKDNFAPRLGLAYQVTPKTVIRSAYGISYVQFNRLGGESLLSYNGPTIVDATIDQIPVTSAGGQALCTTNTQDPTKCFRPTQMGYSDAFASPANFDPLRAQSRYIPKDNPTGYAQSYHLTVQREITPTIVAEMSYVGSHGVHLMTLADYNQARPNALGESSTLQARRPVSTFGTIEEAFGKGFSSYNALQAKIEKRYGHGVYLLNSFTWAHALDNASGHLEAFNGDNSRVNIYNMAGDKGTSSYNVPLTNVLTVLWDLPYGAGRRYSSNSKILNGVLGNWQLSAINQNASGSAINLNYTPTAQASVSSLLTLRPNVSGQVKAPSSAWVKTGSSLSGYFNKAAVSTPSYAQPFGNSSRNSLRGPAFHTLDLGLHKQFLLWSDTSNLEFRMESFNTLNEVNLTTPDPNFSSATFGTFTPASSLSAGAVLPARQVQFALRLQF